MHLTASAPSGITASPPGDRTVPAGDSVVLPVALRDSGVASRTSTLRVTAHASNGIDATTRVTLTHSDDLALNAQGTPFPRIVADASQDRYPAQLAVDGSSSTFWVSWGQTAGQGPTADHPVTYGLDFGAPITVGAVTVGGRSTTALAATPSRCRATGCRGRRSRPCPTSPRPGPRPRSRR